MPAGAALCAAVLCWLARAGAAGPDWGPGEGNGPACRGPAPDRCPSSPDNPVPCCATETSLHDFSFYIHGHVFGIRYDPNSKITLTCSPNMSLDTDALPRFPSEQRVSRVEVQACAPRAALAAVLRALHVRLRPGPGLELELPPGAGLRAALLDALPPLSHFTLTGTASTTVAAGLLSTFPLQQLVRLSVKEIHLQPADLEHLPPTLNYLSLTSTGGGSNVTLPVEALPRDLKILSVRDENPVTLDLTDTRNLEKVIISQWNDSRPEVFVACSQLKTLGLEGTGPLRLPPRWVGGCGRLSVLHLRGVRLARPPARLLQGARSMRELALVDCDLRSLPDGLLDYTANLQHLILSDNKLQVIPRWFFNKSEELISVTLSGNQLSSWAALVTSGLTALPKLNSLLLAENPLDSPCAADGNSPLMNAYSLQLLNLKSTNLKRICRDWRSLWGLQTLDLDNNCITELTYTDLQFNRSQYSVVHLNGAFIDKLSITDTEYRQLQQSNQKSNVSVQLKSNLTCNCDAYFAARAFREGLLPGGLQKQSLLCSSGEPLKSVAVDELLCEEPCPALCRCGRRLVRCAGRTALPALGQLPASGQLPAPGQLPAAGQQKELDFRNNSVSWINESVLGELLAADWRLWLAGNPLRCDCGHGALRLLQRHRRQIYDYDALKCPDGRPLRPAAGCHWRHAAAAAGAALGSLLAALALCGLSPALRLRVKLLLGLARRDRDEDSDDDRPYDAFVSFSHKDERFVSEMVARLESGPRPYRLCVHQRDWLPGEWVPAQIEASVRASRRTLAVVSRAWLASGWARAELRAAAQARARLVLVLLAAPAAAAAHPALRAHLAEHTYVRWGDPWFWRKLRRALPEPRPAPPSAPSAPSAPSRPAPLAASVHPKPARPAPTYSILRTAKTPLADVKLLTMTYFKHERPITPTRP